MKPTLPIEAMFQAKVLAFARLRGWLCYHTFDSRRSTAGFPDLVMVRKDRLVFAELKRSPSHRPTDDQVQWLRALAVVEGHTRGLRHSITHPSAVEVYLWDDQTDEGWREIEEALT